MSRDVFTTPRTRFGNFPPTTKKVSNKISESSPELLELDTSTAPTNSTVPHDEQPNDAISTLPTEIGLQIFSLLDPVTAMCLGLTNRKMYSFYLSHHDEKVVLNQYVVVDGEVLPLHRLMKDWGVKGWVYDGYCPGRFVRGTETVRMHRRIT